MLNNEYLFDKFIQSKNGNVDHDRLQLIRILSRSGTLPKISDIQVQYIHSKPKLFLVEPGKLIRLGINLLNKPLLALVALRYGIEWQIWYKSMKKNEVDYRICDMAAALVVANFIELLPQQDKAIVKDQLPTEFKPLLKKITKSNNETLLDLNSFKKLSKFRPSQNKKSPLSKEWADIISLLAIPTESLLMSGGDVRLNVEDKHLLNVYGCRPFPRPLAFTFASSTATSVSNIAFDLTQKHREFLIKKASKQSIDVAYTEVKEELLSNLRRSLGLSRQSSVLISPSGTDISLLFAGICQSIFPKKIAHILVASDETGSGVPLALQGRHFANNTSLGVDVVKEELITGFEDVVVKKIPLRDKEGKLKTKKFIDKEVDECIRKALEEGLQPVLHVMDQSKLGYAAPTQDYLQNIDSVYGDSVFVLVDNSQLRMDRSRLDEYLKLGFCITITGSKFYTGPPFCGALIVPKKYTEKMKESTKPLPAGLKDYFYKSELIEGVKIFNHLAEGYNIGSYLRWFAAVSEIQRFYQIPIALRSLGAEIFCDHVENRINNNDCLENLENASKAALNPSAEDRRTIFPFFIKKDGKVLTHPETDTLYRLLNKDISSLIKFENDGELRIAKQVCHIGQPVKVVHSTGVNSAVVRISLGSRVLSESWKDRDISIYFQRIEDQMNQVDLILNKIELILKYSKYLIEQND